MLVLKRLKNEGFVVVGHDIEVTVLEIRGDTVKLGIKAPKSVKVLRSELTVRRPGGEAGDVKGGDVKAEEGKGK